MRTMDGLENMAINDITFAEDVHYVTGLKILLTDSQKKSYHMKQKRGRLI